VANRVVTASSVAFGRVLVGQTIDATSTLSTTGDDADFTRVTAGNAGPDANGISATGGTTAIFNGASVTDTRNVGGVFSNAGATAGSLTMITTGEGLTGEAPINVVLNYTADAVNKRVITNGAVTDLGMFHTGAVVNPTSSTEFTTSGTHDTTTDVSVAAGDGVADANGIELTGAATTLDGALSAIPATTMTSVTSPDARTFSGTITSATGGVVSGSFDLPVTSLENGGLGLVGEGTYNPVSIDYTAFVYTGQGVWNASGSGSWGSVTADPNWTADSGAPGLDANFTSTDTATFGNSIGAGTATVTLDGDNPSLQGITFSNTAGGSYILAQGSGGTLRLNGGLHSANITNTGGNNTISAPIELNTDATVSTAANTSLDLAGVISESGAPRQLFMSGTGTVFLNGANTYSGGTTISSGTLSVGNLAGFGTGDVTMHGGVLEAGNGVHEITPQGVGAITIHQLAFRTLASAHYNANEDAIAGYIDNSYSSGTSSLPFQRLIIALNNVTGSGSPSSALPQAFDQLTTENLHNFVRETVFNNASFSMQMLNGYLESQRSCRGDFIPCDGEIDSSNLSINDPSMDPSLAQVSSHLMAWNPAPLPHGLLSDSTQVIPAGFEMADAPTVVPSKGRDLNFFVAGNVTLAQGFSQSDISHFDSTTSGVQLGASYRITPHLEVGTFFDYEHADGNLDTLGSESTIDSYSPGLFVSFADRGWYANAIGSYGFDSFTEDRSVSFGGLTGTSHGTPSGRQIIGNFDGGYDFHVNKWTFGPEAGVQYTDLTVDGFTEQGSAPTDLQVDRTETSSFRSRVGGHVSYPIHARKVLLTPHLDAFWQHEFLDEGQGISEGLTSVGTGSFQVFTPRASRDSALIDLGLNADLNGQVSVYADYLLQAGQNDYFGQSLQLGVKVAF
jgi:autotransporter-associated beta strand protein